MCLFFGNLVQQCDHAECQIVQTIKSLNQQSLFSQVVAHHGSMEREAKGRTEALPSISNLIEEHPQEPYFKEEDPHSMDYHCPAQPYREDSYKQRVVKLQREVSELRQLTFWMKNQLQKKGLLS